MKTVHVVGGPHCGEVLHVEDSVEQVEFTLPLLSKTMLLNILPKDKRKDSEEEFFVLWTERMSS